MDAVNALRAELLQAESILNTKYSFDLAEPYYLRSLQIIAEASNERAAIIDLLKTMLVSGEVSDEPIAYLMHALRWPEIRDWAQARLREVQDPLAHGRHFQKVIAAYSDEWENKAFYKKFTS
jgi:hypothetical protein